LRTGYIISGILLCLVGVGIVLYQVSESCEDSTLAGVYKGYPWCTDILDHINVTFVGVVALFAGIVVLALAGPLHWILEPSPEPDDTGLSPNEVNAKSRSS